MKTTDKLYRFLFEQDSVRGELVQLPQTYAAILANHNYPLPVQRLLGELLVATSLLTALLKFHGDITVQLQGDGPVSLVVINGNNFQQMRGVARYEGDIADDASLFDMLGKGFLMITIKPEDGEAYQGVVELTSPSLSECIQSYFLRSEQLPTHLFIHVGYAQDKLQAAGILLQIMPSHDSLVGLEHLTTLTETITADELFSLSAPEILHRLYHQEDISVFTPQDISFKCFCSRERCSNALMTLSKDELEEMLREDGKISMYCDYCGSHYHFDSVDIEALKKGGQQTPTPIH